MTRTTRQAFAHEVLKDFRNLSYDDCRHLMKRPSVKNVRDSDGKEYQAETQAFWDDSDHLSIRVRASFSEGALSDLPPPNADFIISPSGSFIGED